MTPLATSVIGWRTALVRPACTHAILQFQQGVEGLDHVERSMNEYYADDSKETVMVGDDPLIKMRLAYPEVQCELHLI